MNLQIGKMVACAAVSMALSLCAGAATLPGPGGTWTIAAGEEQTITESEMAAYNALAKVVVNGTLTFAETPVLAGATLTVRTSNGMVDKVVVPDDFDLTGLNLVVEQVGLPVIFAATAFLETSGELSGSFASVTLPAERTKNYSVDVGAASATLSYQKPGLMMILR